MSHTVINIARMDIHVPMAATPHESNIQNTFRMSTPAGSPQGTVVDPATGLMWSRETNATDKTWAEAKTAAEAVRLGGFTDWHLPTRAELLTLVDDTRHRPAINTDLFDCDSDWYWSSTPLASSPSVYAWLVGFSSGDAYYGHQGNFGRVRAVRSVSPAASGQ